MLGYLRIKLGIQRIYGIPFTSLLLFGFFVPWLLRAFPLMCYNQIGQQCSSNGMVQPRELVRSFYIVALVFYSCCLVFSLVGGFLILLLYFLFLSIYLFAISYQNKNKNEGILISQQKYILDLLKETRMSGCKPAKTPIKQSHKLHEGK